jgi:hypothetical protein
MVPAMANADCGKAKTPAMNQQTTTTACNYPLAMRDRSRCSSAGGFDWAINPITTYSVNSSDSILVVIR